ncbi:MAG: hypothetical protein A2Y67_00645 [Candidatus Buchananbacteria bacterium RBG_13_39_9]|uniref:Uncharacterized protein n=1 Tax=Candidatus Buchananbacteria bacterium RBG_13_39_9 TaxID=1797531 RepID=A0A1G1XPL5_9BACT|nr:MAG: hypothetical protein A2Y67_00645 [Candidatus Buchananbacteria bacterium RBG_13_39_9]
MDNNKPRISKFETMSLLALVVICLGSFFTHVLAIIGRWLGCEFIGPEFDQHIINVSWAFFLGLLVYAFCIAMATAQGEYALKEKRQEQEREKFYAKVRKSLRDGEEYEKQMKEPRRKLVEEINQLRKEQDHRREIIRSLEK